MELVFALFIALIKLTLIIMGVILLFGLIAGILNSLFPQEPQLGELPKPKEFTLKDIFNNPIIGVPVILLLLVIINWIVRLF